MSRHDIVADRLKALNIDDPLAVLMQIGETESQFSFVDHTLNVMTLPIGYRGISERYFKHTPPTYDEIEYAINDIEDEIERVAKHIPHDGYHLVTDTAYIKTIAKLTRFDDTVPTMLSRDEMERLFGEYAEIVTGRPARSYEPDISPLFYAQLLIFREYMHHLKFTHVKLID